MLRILVALLLMTAPVLVCAQVLPREGSKLNFRLVGFSAPDETGGKGSTLEIAAGNWNSADSFAKHKVKSVAVPEHKVIVEVPAFGMQYTWRVVGAEGGGKDNAGNSFHHFSTGYSPSIDINNIRLKVLQPAKAYKSAYFFVDNCKALYNMEGKPIWFLPDSENNLCKPFDLKLSENGTLTLLYATGAYEINFNGDVLWQAPDKGYVSGDTTEYYNHQMTKLWNGDYMILGKKRGYTLKELPAIMDTDFLIEDSRTLNSGNDSNYARGFFGTIMEYDRQGRLVWSWKLSDYFKRSDLRYFRKEGKAIFFDLGANAFYFNENKKYIYVSFKLCSRILKIAYPSGKVVASYGEAFKRGTPEERSGLFYGQHACNIDKDGELYLYDNNMKDSNSMSKIMVLSECAGVKDSLVKKWEYLCRTDDIAYNYRNWRSLAAGGNVFELPDKSFFVCMSGASGKVFIVDRDKQVLWSVVVEEYRTDKKEWQDMAQYRASIVADPKDVEKLIWDAENFRGGARKIH